MEVNDKLNLPGIPWNCPVCNAPQLSCTSSAFYGCGMVLYELNFKSYKAELHAIEVAAVCVNFDVLMAPGARFIMGETCYKDCKGRTCPFCLKGKDYNTGDYLCGFKCWWRDNTKGQLEIQRPCGLFVPRTNLVLPKEKIPHPCKCDTQKVLMVSGCVCGGV